MTTTQLTPAQHAILAKAINTSSGKIEWFPDNIKGGARKKVLDGLFNRALITPDGDGWCVAAEGYDALGMKRPELPQPTSAFEDELDKIITNAEAQWQQEATGFDGQLSVWFAHVRQLQNPVIAAYLQTLLLIGARREELAELKWEDINFQWRGLDLKDKIEERRAVPLTPYVAHLLATLPRRNEWVFSSVGSASGRLTEPSIAHRQACAAAGLELTLHGLRRSFASLCEWLDIPGGISAQIQGHAPQGVREQNYIRRPLDLLRVHHERIEAWIAFPKFAYIRPYIGRERKNPAIF
jgi:integrase